MVKVIKEGVLHKGKMQKPGALLTLAVWWARDTANMRSLGLPSKLRHLRPSPPQRKARPRVCRRLRSLNLSGAASGEDF